MSDPRGLAAALGALLLLLVAAGAFLFLQSGPPAGGPLDAQAGPEPLPALSAGGESEDGSLSAADAPARTATTGDHRAGAAAAPTAADRDLDLHGLVVTPAGEPFAGARVAVVRRPGEEYSLLDRDHNAELLPVAEGETDARGEFAFRIPPGRPHDLRVDGEGYAPVVLRNRFAGERVLVELAHSASVQGHVRRRADGDPVAGATVRLAARTDDWRVPRNGGRHETLTDANGAYHVGGVQPGTYTIDVYPRVEASPRAEEIELKAGTPFVHDVEVDAGARIRGRVTDARTQQPIAGAEVAEGELKRVTTDPAGEYVLEGFAHIRLVARAGGYSPAVRRVRDRGDADVPEVVDFELEPARGARGRVLGPDGEPLPGAYVAAVASEYRGEPAMQHTDWQSARTGGDGRYRVSGLRSDLAHTLFVKKEGFGAVAFAFPPDELGREGEVVLPDVRLDPGAAVRGRVIDESDEPIADLPVGLFGLNDDRFRFGGEDDGEYRSIDGYIAQKSARTDDLGRFAFVDLAPGTYAVRARIPGVHEPAEAEVALASAEVVEDVVLVLERGLAIEGRVTTPDGGTLPKTYISFDPEAGGRPADLEVAADGSFRAEGLTAGLYSLSVYPYASDDDRAAGRVFNWQRKKHVRAGERGVEIELVAAAEIGGTVVDADGNPVARAYVEAFDADGDPAGGASTDAAGRFTMRLSAGQVVSLSARPPSPEVPEGAKPPKPDPATFARLARVTAGESGLRLELLWRP